MTITEKIAFAARIALQLKILDADIAEMEADRAILRSKLAELHGLTTFEEGEDA